MFLLIHAEPQRRLNYISAEISACVGYYILTDIMWLSMHENKPILHVSIVKIILFHAYEVCHFISKSLLHLDSTTIGNEVLFHCHCRCQYNYSSMPQCHVVSDDFGNRSRYMGQICAKQLPIPAWGTYFWHQSSSGLPHWKWLPQMIYRANPTRSII